MKLPKVLRGHIQSEVPITSEQTIPDLDTLYTSVSPEQGREGEQTSIKQPVPKIR
jgi:hypothetical protein